MLNAEIKPYPKRWLIVSLFCCLSLINAFQWIQFSAIGDISRSFFGITEGQLDWFSLIYMVVYIPLIFPCAYGLEKYGLMHAVVISSTCNALGSSLKVLGSGLPDHFAISLIGQGICGVAQVWILGLPALLAATWFGANEVSLATSIGVFGNQLGVAFGFLIPSLFVSQSSKYNFVNLNKQMANLNYFLAVCSLGVQALILSVFRNKPPKPPSYAQAEIEKEQLPKYAPLLLELMKNRDFVLLMLSYGFNTGAFYSFSTLLNPVLSAFFEGHDDDIGRIGLVFVLAGLFGSITFGYLLDKTHKFKICCTIAYASTLVFFLVFTFTLHFRKIGLEYIVAAILGFFMTGYLPVGFEYAAELTYPVSEGVTSGLLNMSSQVFGIVLTISSQKALKYHGSTPANLIPCVFLFVGLVLTVLVRENLKRRNFENKEILEHTLATMCMDNLRTKY